MKIASVDVREHVIALAVLPGNKFLVNSTEHSVAKMMD